MIELHSHRPFSALRRLAREASQQADAMQEHCELCSESIPYEHRHLLDMVTREIVCVCRACSIFFDKEAASQGKHRLVPDRRLALENFHISETQWENLRIPVGIAFVLYSTTISPTHPERAETRPFPEGQQVVAFYPSPMGPTESLLDLDTWTMLLQSNPVLSEMARDVEALLINRARGARQYFLAPIDECYRLVGMIRLHWKGLSGGQQVWKEVGRFFDALQARSKRVRNERHMDGLAIKE